MWVRARAASSKGTISLVPAWFRADSGTNLIKQGEIVAGRLCGSVAHCRKPVKLMDTSQQFHFRGTLMM